MQVDEREPGEEGAGDMVKTRSWERSVMAWFSFLKSPELLSVEEMTRSGGPRTKSEESTGRRGKK